MGKCTFLLALPDLPQFLPAIRMASAKLCLHRDHLYHSNKAAKDIEDVSGRFEWRWQGGRNEEDEK